MDNGMMITGITILIVAVDAALLEKAWRNQ